MHTKCSVLLASALLVLLSLSSSIHAAAVSEENAGSAAVTLDAVAKVASAANATDFVFETADDPSSAQLSSGGSSNVGAVVDIGSELDQLASLTSNKKLKPAALRKQARKAAKAAAALQAATNAAGQSETSTEADKSDGTGGASTASASKTARRYNPVYVRPDSASQYNKWAKGSDGKYRLRGGATRDSGSSDSGGSNRAAQPEQPAEQQPGAQQQQPEPAAPTPRPRYPLGRYTKRQQQRHDAPPVPTPAPAPVPEAPSPKEHSEEEESVHAEPPARGPKHEEEEEEHHSSQKRSQRSEDDAEEDSALPPKSVGQVRDASAELHIIYSGEEGEEPSPADLDGGLIWSVSADSGSNSLGQLQPDGPYGPWHVQATQIYKWARVSGMRPFLSISGPVDAPTAVRINGRLGGIVPSSKHQTQLTSTASLASGGRVPRAFSEHTQVRLPQPEHCVYKWTDRETQRTVECRGSLAALPELEFHGTFLQLLDAGLHQDLEFMSRVQVSCEIEHCQTTKQY